jgi:hypothetical protein
MTEDEQLANLRENPNWQPKLDPLAEEATAKGRLARSTSGRISVGEP